MNFEKLDSFTNIVFGIILAIGLIFVSLVGLIFVKATPGALMFLIYLYDSLKGGFNLSEVGNLGFLMVTTGLWGISALMIGRMVVSVYKTYWTIIDTGKFIGSLRVVGRRGSIVCFNSERGEIFTAGIFQPKIFISNNLSKMHTDKEIRAMIAHEKQHVKTKDPLRTTLVVLVGKMLPEIPGKEKMIRFFNTLTEVCADREAETKMSDRLPVISALYKRLEMANSNILTGINFFSSQSERISILVGKSRLQKGGVWGLGAVLAVGVIILAGVVTKINFYDCSHLVNCLLSFSSAYNLH